MSALFDMVSAHKITQRMCAAIAVPAGADGGWRVEGTPSLTFKAQLLLCLLYLGTLCRLLYPPASPGTAVTYLDQQ